MSPPMNEMNQPPVDADRLTAARAMMQGLIDYAGLFPPAKLAMPDAVRTYGKHLASDDAWMLGRFIAPVSRLSEFSAAGKALLPSDDRDDEPWPLSVLIDGDLTRDLETIARFNRHHADPSNGLAFIDAIELRVPATGSALDADFIDNAIDVIPDDLFPFFELAVVPPGPGLPAPDPRGCITTLSGLEAGAKIRTGGITPDAFPSAAAVARFLEACVGGDVPFKATAGLHHALRGEYPLTYEPNCPRGVMHGFLNVFAAAVLALTEDAPADRLEHVLTRADARSTRFEPARLSIAGQTMLTEQIEAAREGFALSYGSCSFIEPVSEMRAMGAV
jgi:hypothetical protein